MALASRYWVWILVLGVLLGGSSARALDMSAPLGANGFFLRFHPFFLGVETEVSLGTRVTAGMFAKFYDVSTRQREQEQLGSAGLSISFFMKSSVRDGFYVKTSMEHQNRTYLDAGVSRSDSNLAASLLGGYQLAYQSGLILGVALGPHFSQHDYRSGQPSRRFSSNLGTELALGIKI